MARIAVLLFSGLTLAIPQVTPCDDIENIIGDFGFVQGSMGPAVSSPVLRQLASAMDSVLSDLDTLSNAIPACNKGSSEKSPAVCDELAKLSNDMGEVASAWVNVMSATNLPRTFDVNGLVPFVDDAVNVTLPLIQTALQESDSCT